MEPSDNTTPLRRWLLAAAYLAAVAIGLKFGFDFGHRISGTVLGVVLAINGALFCSFVVSMVADKLSRVNTSRTRRP